MRTFLALSAFCLFAAATPPPISSLAEGQVRRSDGIHIGSKNTDVLIDGNLYVTSPDGGSYTSTPGSSSNPVGTSKVAVLDAGVAYFNGQVTAIANVDVTGNVSTASLDAGSLFLRGSAQIAGTVQGVLSADLVDAGTANFMGPVEFNRPIKCGGVAVCGSVALSSGTPSTATATVETGSSCVCWPVGTTAAIAAGGCAANVSSTTATFTGPNTVTTTVRYMCWL